MALSCGHGRPHFRKALKMPVFICLVSVSGQKTSLVLEGHLTSVVA